MKVITDKKKLDAIFDRGIVSEVLPSKKELYKKLQSGKKLRIYIGADPTAGALHLSHAKNYQLLEEFRQLGHEAIVLFGDFTARIGDPTERDSARTQLSATEVKKNVKAWVSQIKPLLNFSDKKNPPKILYNSQWLVKLNFEDIIGLASNFTVQQMLERDMFEKRIEKGNPIHLHEFFYPLMQGYDSVAMDVDIELCGTDQIFNALAGRTLLKRLKNKEKFVIAVNLMENPKTKELMSKSRGVGVFLNGDANNMFDSIMSQPDEMIQVMYINNTRLPLKELETILKSDPRSAKIKVAHEIVKNFFGEKKADEAQENSRKKFAEKDPSSAKLPHWKVKKNKLSVLDIVLSPQDAPLSNLSSKSEAQRLISQGGVQINGETKKDRLEVVEVRDGDLLKIGKRQFFKIKL